MWACWFLRDPTSQQLLYLNTRAFFAIFLGKLWERAMSVSYRLPGVGNPPSHFKREQGRGGTASNGTQDAPAGSLFGYKPRLFPCHLDCPLFPLIFKRSQVTHTMESSVYYYRGNNWKQTNRRHYFSLFQTGHSCDHNDWNNRKKKNNCPPVESRHVFYEDLILMWCMRAQLLSLVRLLATPWTVTHQAPLSMGFSRQEYWSGWLRPPPGDLPDYRTCVFCSSCVEGRLFFFFTAEPLGKPPNVIFKVYFTPIWNRLPLFFASVQDEHPFLHPFHVQ